MARDLLQVEQRREEVVLVLRPESRRLIAVQPAGSRRPQVREHGHERRAGPFVLINRIVILAVDAAIDDVNQAVALAAGGMLEKRRGDNALAAGREHDIDGIVHAAGHHRLDVRSRRAGSEKHGRARVTNGCLPGRS